MLRKLRVVAQILFFILFAGSFFWLNRNPTALSWPSEWFLWLNPLVMALTGIAARSVILPLALFGGVLLVVTLLFGRVFCGHLCPLGAVIDFSDRFLLKGMHAPRRRPPRYVQKFKYVLLAVLLVLAMFGVLFPLIMDPLSLLTRFFSLILYPLAALVSIELLQPLARLLGLSGIAYASLSQPQFYEIALAGILMVLILAAGFWDRRFFCQYVCPSGAFFGLLSRFAIFRRHVVKERCSECQRCTRLTCPTRAIDEKNVAHTSVAECLACGLCAADSRGCTRFAFLPVVSRDTKGADVGRRHVVAGLAAGLALTPALRSDAIVRRDSTGRLIRPPGSVPENDLLARCIACGECMKVCPTNAIQPCGLGDGLRRLFSPKIVPRIGGCEEKCFVCGHVCPTGAIRPLPYEQKRFVKIGTAVVDRHRCLAWEQGRECLVCDEVCPYNAITATIVQTTTGRFKVPLVDEDLCIGCGICEQQCPIFDEAAIVVYKFGENRLREGPYLSDAQKQSVLARRRASDEGIGEALAPAQSALPEGFAGEGQPSPAQAQQLPPGFEIE